MSSDQLGPGDEGWQWMCQRYPSDPRLREATIYALPHRLLRAIMTSAPDLLTLADYRFEYRLRQQAETGFFQGRAFACELLDPLNSSEVAADTHLDRRPAALRDVQLTMHRAGTAPAQAETVCELQQSLASRILERRQGFAGWLITNSDFRAELATGSRLGPTRPISSRSFSPWLAGQLRSPPD